MAGFLFYKIALENSWQLKNLQAYFIYRNNAEEKIMKTIDQHQEEIMKRTDEIVVGAAYWLSSFHDKDGAYVEVLKK